MTGREPTGMRIAVIGCGYLGAVHAAGLAAMGHHVIGIDRDVEKAEALARGEAPFYEPGLPELLREALGHGPAAVHDRHGRGPRVHRPLRVRGHARRSAARTPPT